jgi:hypothetical protein
MRPHLSTSGKLRVGAKIRVGDEEVCICLRLYGLAPHARRHAVAPPMHERSPVSSAPAVLLLSPISFRSRMHGCPKSAARVTPSGRGLGYE